MTHDGAAPPAALAAGDGAGAARIAGPDGDGHYRSGDVGMMQTRLAIIDLATGDQPLYEPGGAALIANGEIYNYIELRARAWPDVDVSRPSPIASCRCTSTGGTGSTSPQHLRGMYAIALHDPGSRPAGPGARSVRHQAALLCRDAARSSRSPPNRRR